MEDKLKRQNKMLSQEPDVFGRKQIIVFLEKNEKFKVCVKIK